MTADGDEEGEARVRALALLEATHQFPCHYAVTVIAFNRETVALAIRDAACPSGLAGEENDANVLGSAEGYEGRASREGKYRSHRFEVRVADAAAVLELYARLRAVEGVVTIL